MGKGRGGSGGPGGIQLFPCKCSTAEKQTLALGRHTYLQLLPDPEGPLTLCLDPVGQFLHVQKVSLVLLPGQTLLQDSNP